MKRVVVTGIGLISSIGNNLESTWNNLISGTSGIKKITNFDTEQLSCKIAGFISHEETDELYLNRNNFLDNREINRNDRFIQYGLIAAKLAREGIIQDSKALLKWLHKPGNKVFKTENIE